MGGKGSTEAGKISGNFHGSSRNRRSLPALHPDYFKIEERTLADFLVFTEKYAAYVLADGFDENGNVNITALKNNGKTWKSFFANDVSVFLAKIFCGKPEKKITYSIREGIELPHINVLKKLDSFLSFVSILSDTIPYALQLKSKDQKISHLLLQLDELTVLANKVLAKCKLAGIIVDFDRLPDILSVEDKAGFVNLPERELMTMLDASLDSFLAMSHKVSYTAQEMFHDSLQNYEHHNPAVALLIAFLKLYDHVQQDLNQITGKHLDFFFKTLLQQGTRPPEPDKVYVCFILSDHVETCTIEKGALFKANIDEDGLDCLYETEEYITLNKTQVTDIGSFYISKKEEIGIEPHYEFISSIFESPLLSSKTGGFNFSDWPKPFPPFGEDQYDIKLKTMEPSEIGFAIASPVLLLREGVRKVNLTIQFNLKSMSSLVAFFERYSKNEKLSADKVFHKVFSEAFKISVTTSKGWYTIADYKVLPPDWGNGKVEFAFTLPMGAPALLPMGEEWDKKILDRYDTQWPVMKVCLSDEKAMYTYSYLQHLIINECEIRVNVSGIKNLEVYNDLGKVETSTPFYPFGPLPVAGSSFVIGNEELYKKQIEDFSLEINWHNLPKNEGGFREYYEEYNEDIDNDSFKVGITALSDYEFYPKAADKMQVFPLFTTIARDNEQSSAHRLSPKTVIREIDIKALKINSELEKAPLQPFDNTTKTGYIKLELVEPEIGFGHQEYATLMPAKIMRKVKDGDLRLPNPPYIPQMKSIALNYEGFTRISFQKLASTKADPQAEEKIFQLQPFGMRTIFANCSPVIDNLFPQYHHSGYLILGLDTITFGEPVSFCFVLEQSAVVEFEAAIPEVEWFFVSDDNWIAFDKKSVIFDTTKNFTTSGIVKLMMPFAITNTNTILPSGRYWIIAGLKGDPQLAGKIRGVYTQAVALHWKSHKAGAMWRNNIPPYTIESMVVSRSEIATIFQPMASFGGRPAESQGDFYTRVSERLAHKNRAVTAWDIERLVLEKFPSVRQAKCISPIDHEQFVKPGEIILVVVPKFTVADDFLPRFNTGELKSMQEYLEKHMSPFVDVTVTNPAYEEVKITASIVLMDETSKGGNGDELHRDVLSFICPWYADPHEDMMFGGWIDLDEITDFLCTRPYVKSVSRVSIVIVHYNNKSYTITDSVVSTDVNKTLFASRPWSVLIPMKNHQITVQEKDEHLTPEKAAIENMRLGNEFVIVEQKQNERQEDAQQDGTIFKEYISFEVDL